MDPIRFDERVVAITGAGGGLGRAYALLCAARGARVVVNDLGVAVDGNRASDGSARSVADEIIAAGGRAMANTDDVSLVSGAERLIAQTVAAFGTVDAVVCNAGILRDRTLLNLTPEDFDGVVRVHLLGTVNVARAAFRVMRERRYGRIVVTTSVVGLYGNFGQTNYGAAKLGVVGFMNSLKHEGARYGILVNAISPLAFTRMGATVLPAALSTALRPELVAPAVAYLCSDQCTRSGDIISAGAGSYTRAQVVESHGVQFAPGDITPEMIAERYSEIADMTDPIAYSSAQESISAVVARASSLNAATGRR
ncbi:MAG: SDR family NAD(P)-dependent oxidoreductase [Gemmatimonadaceae bacterium]